MYSMYKWEYTHTWCTEKYSQRKDIEPLCGSKYRYTKGDKTRAPIEI